MTPHCQAKSCTFTFTKCKWECTVRAQGSTALLPRKLQWKFSSQLSTGRQSLTSQSCHWESYGEIDGDYRQCPLNACVQLKMAFMLSVSAMDQGQSVSLSDLSFSPTMQRILQLFLNLTTRANRATEHQQLNFCSLKTSGRKVYLLKPYMHHGFHLFYKCYLNNHDLIFLLEISCYLVIS